MSQQSNDKRRRFEQKMREQGADGFADGPRPWETWDESGHQANNRIWEGSARRVNGKYRKHSLGYRILSVLAFMALATLLVGIGGVYYTHITSQQVVVAETGVQPLPVINHPPPVIAAADSEVVVAAVTETQNLNVLRAPAAGNVTAQPEAAAVAETAVTNNEAMPQTDEATSETTRDATAIIATDAIPAKTNGTIDSVAIETVVTEKSITTTVYTRHPQQDEPEIVSAIETTPPPFAHEIVSAEEQAPDFPPVAQTDTLKLTAVDTVDHYDTAALHETQLDALPDEETAEQTTGQIGDATTTVEAEESSASTISEPPAEVATEVTEDYADVIVTEPPTELADSTGTVSAVEITAETTADHGDAIVAKPPAEQPEEPTTLALAEDSSEAAAVPESPAEAAAEVIEEQLHETVEPVIPAAKTGNWVINLASYTWKSTASRKQALFQQQGVDAEVFEVMINDKPMYRVRVVGFESSRTAKAEIPAVEQKLNLEGAWISKR